MAAINTALSTFNDAEESRPWVFPADVYSGTVQYAVEVLESQRGTNVRFADPAGANSTTANRHGHVRVSARPVFDGTPIRFQD